MLGIRLKTILSLKVYILLSFIIFWNAGFLFGRYLGGDVRGSFAPIAVRTYGAVCGAACIFFLFVANPKVAQRYFVSPSRGQNYRPREFYLLAFLMGAMAINFIFAST